MLDFVGTEISSKKNDIVKYASSLLTAKGRKKEGAFRFDGIKLLCEALRCDVKIDTLLLKSDKAFGLLSKIDECCVGWRESTDARAVLLKDAVFDAISEENAPEGIICIAKYLDKSKKSGTIIRRSFFLNDAPSVLDEEKAHGRIMAAESIRDPGNLGTIIRTCKALGVDGLYISSDCADILSPKVIRSSMGAVFALPVFMCKNISDSLSGLKSEGYRILATALHSEATALSRTKLSADDVFVIGNEGHGLSSSVLSVADACVYIDMYSGPGCESLNAGVACAVCAWEQKRQLGFCSAEG